MKLNWYNVNFTLPFVDQEEFPMLCAFFDTLYDKVKKPKGVALFGEKEYSGNRQYFVCISDSLPHDTLTKVLKGLEDINKRECVQPRFDSLEWLEGDEDIFKTND